MRKNNKSIIGKLEIGSVWTSICTFQYIYQSRHEVDDYQKTFRDSGGQLYEGNKLQRCRSMIPILLTAIIRKLAWWCRYPLNSVTWFGNSKDKRPTNKVKGYVEGRHLGWFRVKSCKRKSLKKLGLRIFGILEWLHRAVYLHQKKVKSIFRGFSACTFLPKTLTRWYTEWPNIVQIGPW